MKYTALIVTSLLALCTTSVHADTNSAQKLADKYAAIAKNINSSYEGPSAEKGKEFFNEKVSVKGKEIACASCHTSNPADPGKHIVTGKPISPLSPNANPKRFSNLDKVEKNFTKHCNDILGKDCTAEEKANYIAYMISAK